MTSWRKKGTDETLAEAQQREDGHWLYREVGCGPSTLCPNETFLSRFEPVTSEPKAPQLLPCPFCGNSPSILTLPKGRLLECSTCEFPFIGRPGVTVAQMIEKWNHREPVLATAPSARERRMAEALIEDSCFNNGPPEAYKRWKAAQSEAESVLASPAPGTEKAWVEVRPQPRAYSEQRPGDEWEVWLHAGEQRHAIQTSVRRSTASNTGSALAAALNLEVRSAR